MADPVRSLVLSEGYVGLENQALGLADAAGFRSRVCRIAPRGLWARLPAARWPRPLGAVTGLALGDESVAISCGGTAAAVAAALRQRHGRPVVQIQHPRMRLDRFDVVVVNRHDRVTGPNVVTTRTALHRVTASALADADATWRERLRVPGKPLVSVLVGGANGRFRLGRAEALSLGGALAAMCRRDGVALAVTPSRRTAPEAVAALAATLAGEAAWIWDGTGPNPYLGLLAAADAIVATCDSVSMVSEAVATRAPVHVALLPGRSRRIGLFLDALRDAGRIRLFDGRFDPFAAVPLDDTAEAAHDTRRRLGY